MSGDESILPLPKIQSPPIVLSAEERSWLDDLPFGLAITKIAKNHFHERCANCNRFIGNHTLKQNKRCLARYWAKEAETAQEKSEAGNEQPVPA